jgi:hypothetical protein
MYLQVETVDQYIATIEGCAVPMDREPAALDPLDGEAEEARASQNRYIVAMYQCNLSFLLFPEVSARFTGANRWVVASVESLIATVIWYHALISR